MSDTNELIHYGVKGQKWGVRTQGGGWSVGAGISGGAGSGAKAPAGPSKSAPPKAPAAKRAAPSKPTASPTRNFRDASGKASSSKNSSTSSLNSKTSKRTPEQAARRKKMIIGGVAVVGILGVAAAGTAAYKGAPIAKYHVKSMAAGGRKDVQKLLAQPKIANARMQGGRKVNKIKLNALIKQAEVANRFGNSSAGLRTNKAIGSVKRNPTVARAAIRRDLNSLRGDTAALKAINDGQDFIAKTAQQKALKKSEKRFATEAARLVANRVKEQAKPATPKISAAEKRAAADLLRRFGNAPPRPRNVPGWALPPR